MQFISRDKIKKWIYIVSRKLMNSCILVKLPKEQLKNNTPVALFIAQYLEEIVR